MPADPMHKPDDRQIQESISSLGEEITAAELVRQKGQTKKLKMVSKDQLTEWVKRLLDQFLAAREGSYTDREKEELLRKTQEQLALRIKREQDADAAAKHERAEKERLIQRLEQAQTANSTREDLDAAIKALRAKIEEQQQINADLQQDNYDLHDQLQEQMALVSSTIAEKDGMRAAHEKAMKDLMLHSGDLVARVQDVDQHILRRQACRGESARRRRRRRGGAILP